MSTVNSAASSHRPVVQVKLPPGELDFVSQAGDLQPWLYNIFSQLHEAPELSFEETATSALVHTQLQQHNIAFTVPVARICLLASVGHESPVVYLRADVDALPVEEEAPQHCRSSACLPSMHFHDLVQMKEGMCSSHFSHGKSLQVC